MAFASAGVAVAVVVLLGVIVHRPLVRVPENAMKLGVGVLLSSFGTFWVVEGFGGEWPGSELAVAYVAAAYSVATFLIVRLLARSTASHSDGDDGRSFGGDGFSLEGGERRER